MPRIHIDMRRLMKMKVKEIMNKKPPLCDPKTHVLDLLQKLLKQKEDYVLVVDKGKKLLGIITESDILHALKRPSKYMFFGAKLVSETYKEFFLIFTKFPYRFDLPELTFSSGEFLETQCGL